MYKRILVPLDGSKLATEALPLARLLAGKVGAEIHLAHVIPPTFGLGLEEAGEAVAARTRVKETVEGYLLEQADASNSAVPTTVAVLDGSIVPELHSYIERMSIDLVTLTSHGSGSLHRWWRGSVAEGIYTAGGVELLVVQPWDETGEIAPGHSRFARILVPLDGTADSESALPRAREMAALFGAELVLIYVVPSPIELTSIYGVSGVELAGEGHQDRIEDAGRYLESISARHPEVSCETRVVESSGIAEGILESARDLGADLIVLAGHGKSGMERVLLGSVTDRVLRGTTRPVLVVRPPREA